MKNMVQIRKKNSYFVAKLFFELSEKVLWGLSALRAPTVGPFCGYYTELQRVIVILAIYFLLQTLNMIRGYMHVCK